jgi:hypothetical protein
MPRHQTQVLPSAYLSRDPNSYVPQQEQLDLYETDQLRNVEVDENITDPPVNNTPTSVQVDMYG